MLQLIPSGGWWSWSCIAQNYIYLSFLMSDRNVPKGWTKRRRRRQWRNVWSHVCEIALGKCNLPTYRRLQSLVASVLVVVLWSCPGNDYRYCMLRLGEGGKEEKEVKKADNFDLKASFIIVLENHIWLVDGFSRQ